MVCDLQTSSTIACEMWHGAFWFLFTVFYYMCALQICVIYTSGYIKLKCVNLENSYSKYSLRISYPNAIVIDDSLMTMITSWDELICLSSNDRYFQ